MILSPKRFAQVSAGLACAGLLVARFAYGPVAGRDFAFGVLTIALSLFGLWGLTQAMTPGIEWNWLRLTGLAALFIHLPLFVVAAKAIQRDGGPGPAAFLLGGALVYCLAVTRVLTRPS